MANGDLNCRLRLTYNDVKKYTEWVALHGTQPPNIHDQPCTLNIIENPVLRSEIHFLASAWTFRARYTDYQTSNNNSDLD